MRLNEYLVVNTDDSMDDYGLFTPWVELFNSSYGSVDIKGCYLSDDPSNLKKYQIPAGDIRTMVQPRQFVIFRADNDGLKGTFHLNFDLENADEVIFTKGDGITIVDRIKIRHDLSENVSFGREVDGEGSIDGSGEGWVVLSHTSPATNNTVIDAETKADKMREMDPYGWMMALLAMSVVFIALIILYLIFKNIGKVNIRKEAKKAAAIAAPAAPVAAIAPAKKTAGSEDEINAAIVAALEAWMEDTQVHDVESFVLTINPVQSAWNDKHQMLMQLPQMKK